MALCDIAEFASAVIQQGEAVQVAQEPPLIQQPQLAVTGTHADSLPFGPNTRFIWMSTDVPLRFRIAAPVAGVAVAATATDRRLPQDGILFAGVTPGHCISVILTT